MKTVLKPEERSGAFSRRLVLAMQLRDPMPAKLLGHLSGYSSGYIQSLMSGSRGQVPTLGCCKALADVLKVDPAWLAGWKGDDGYAIYTEEGNQT